MGDWRALCREEGWTIEGQRIEVPLANKRSHRVFVEELAERLDLTARVAAARRLEAVEDVELLVWRRNARTRLVTFHVDRRGAVIGQVQLSREGLTRDELRLCVHTLANECDRMEHLLTGEDLE